MQNLRFISSRSSPILLGLAIIAAFGMPTRGQDPTAHGAVVTDWSARHVIFSDPGSERGAIEKGRYDHWWKITSDPRYMMQQRRRHHEPGPPRDIYWQKEAPGPHRDWAVSLGAGTVAQNQSPAKFSFNVNAAPSCATDFAVYGLNHAGTTGGQANLVGLNNLYSGTISGTFTGQSAVPPTGSTITVTLTGTDAATQTIDASTGTQNGTHFEVSTSPYTTEATNLAASINANTSLNPYVTATASGATVTLSSTIAGETAAFSTSGTSHFAQNTPNPFCGSLTPSYFWAYNATNHGGTITTSPSISDDATGSKIIYIESGGGTGPYLHILQWNSANGGTATASKAPTNILTTGLGVGTCPAGGGSCLVSILLNSTTETITNSSPYYDYGSDTVYVGDDAGNLYKVTSVLSGTPAVTKVNLATTKLTSPVYDSTSGYVFVGGSNGVLYAETTGLTAPAHPSIQVGHTACTNGGLIDSPVVDGTQGYVYETSMTGTDDTHTVVVQAYTDSTPGGSTTTNYPGGSSGWTAAATANVGDGDTSCNASGAFYAHAPAFDNAYYTSPSTGHLLAGGADTDTSTDYPAFWSVNFTGTPALLHTATEFTGTGSIPQTTATNEGEISPLTEIYNNGTDYVFAGAGASGTYGALFGFTVSGGAYTHITGSPIAYPDAQGGTSGIVVDNVSSDAQASSVYFTTQATSTSVCGSTSAYCAIKLTQSALQ